MGGLWSAAAGAAAPPSELLRRAPPSTFLECSRRREQRLDVILSRYDFELDASIEIGFGFGIFGLRGKRKPVAKSTARKLRERASKMGVKFPLN